MRSVPKKPRAHNPQPNAYVERELAWRARKQQLQFAGKPRAVVVRLPAQKRIAPPSATDEPRSTAAVLDYPRSLRWCDCRRTVDCVHERRRRKYLAKQKQIRALAAEVAALRDPALITASAARTR